MIDEKGYYVIKDYDKQSPFASFLAGIAGVKGKPLWSFFVNRGQGISSFGIKDKNGCMMEFFPAHEAYQRVYSHGFRSFLKVNHEANYEPFAVSRGKHIARTMRIKNNELQLEEANSLLGIEVTVTYFIIPEENFGALARSIEIKNINTEEINIELIDGMPALLPYGMPLKDYKEMGNTLKSWMQAEITADERAIYKLRASSEDTVKVEAIKGTFYYRAFDEKDNKLRPIIDPTVIFDYDTSYHIPVGFLKKEIEELTDNASVCYNKVPSAFTLSKKVLKPHSKMAVYSYIGYAEEQQFKESDDRVCTKLYFDKQLQAANGLIEEVIRHVATKTAYPLWDAYVKQCYLDNVLRGGYPIQIGNERKETYYIYSRKHGDLERDYNFFSIEPNYYSQGNANFRDVCQNRRMDVFIHPHIKKENIEQFYNLIQIDGYNSLVIKGKKFKIAEAEKLQKVLRTFDETSAEIMRVFLKEEFTIGELFERLTQRLDMGFEEAERKMNDIIDSCEAELQADFGEGFWIDHWTYNLDLAEQFLEIYPDKRSELLMGEKKYRFFNSDHYVLPRCERYILEEGHVRQYNCIRKKEEKLEGPWLKTKNGEIYSMQLMSKMLSLAVIKFAGLDPYGIGIEMEAGKPGWNDAMNGMPGLLGSSTGELFELKRFIGFIINNLDVIVTSVSLPMEFKELTEGLETAIDALNDEAFSDIEYWDAASKLRERFREKTMYNISGEEYVLSTIEVKQLLEKLEGKIDKGIEKLKNLTKEIMPTFLYYETERYIMEEALSGKEWVKPTALQLHLLPDFLEGPMRYLKTDLKQEEKEALYAKVKQSEIYDSTLKMYKVSASLEEMPFQIGRTRIFTPGWLERESIFMHMSFKYLLELLKNQLYDAFFEDMKHAMPPFMNPKAYGRSLLENSSFIASSANPDEAVHGKGFVARLSGTTAELLQMWKIMMTGDRLFSYQDNQLVFKLSPILTRDFFDEKDEVHTTLLGDIQLIYINKSRKDTFGEKGGSLAKLMIHYKDGQTFEIEGDCVFEIQAEAIRSKQVSKIIGIIE